MDMPQSLIKIFHLEHHGPLEKKELHLTEEANLVFRSIQKRMLQQRLRINGRCQSIKPDETVLQDRPDPRVHYLYFKNPKSFWNKTIDQQISNRGIFLLSLPNQLSLEENMMKALASTHPS